MYSAPVNGFQEGWAPLLPGREPETRVEGSQQGPAWTQEVAAPPGQQKQNRGFVLPESLCVGCSQLGLGPARLSTVKPCFLEYKTCRFLSSPGPRRAGGTSFPRSPAPRPLPAPRPHPFQSSKQQWCQEVARRGVGRRSAPPKLHQRKPCQTNTPKSLSRR